MRKFKHTPGPWKVSVENEGSIFGDLNNPKHDGDSPYIGTVAGIGPDKKNKECKANAKLIAAAPELLAAIVEALDFIKAHNHYVAAGMIDKLQSVIGNATT